VALALDPRALVTQRPDARAPLGVPPRPQRQRAARDRGAEPPQRLLGLVDQRRLARRGLGQQRDERGDEDGGGGRGHQIPCPHQ
jgi:hypothetical protein